VAKQYEVRKTDQVIGGDTEVWTVRMVASEPVNVWRTPDGTCRCVRCSGPLTAMSATCPHARAVKRAAGVAIPRATCGLCGMDAGNNPHGPGVCVTAGVQEGGAKRLPMVPTSHMMNAAVNAWHSWKSRDSGGNVQLLGKLMWEHMADAAPEPGAWDDASGVALPDGGQKE
jgi:hypothetical protein